MTRRTKMLLLGLFAVAVLALGAGIAVAAATSGEEPLTGETHDRAVAAALEHTGGGVVTETELGDGGAAYGVEITLNDGSQVEVELNEQFEVIGSAPDEDGPGDIEEGDTEEGLEDEAVEDDAAEADDQPGEAEDAKPDVAITGPDLERASAVALEFTDSEYGPGGTVTDTEIEDEESYYEVEITLPDGTQIDVQLDENFIVVGTD